MENTFSHTKMTTIWLIASFAIGIVVSWQSESGFIHVGEIGLETIIFGGVLGCFSTRRFFSWNKKVDPSQLEGILGWSGAALMVAAIIGYALRVALGKA